MSTCQLSVKLLRHPAVYGVIINAVISNPSMYLYELRRHLYQSTGIKVTICQALKLGFYMQGISIRQCDIERLWRKWHILMQR